jgi:hypothetical protein
VTGTAVEKEQTGEEIELGYRSSDAGAMDYCSEDVVVAEEMRLQWTIALQRQFLYRQYQHQHHYQHQFL